MIEMKDLFRIVFNQHLQISFRNRIRLRLPLLIYFIFKTNYIYAL